MKVRAAVAADTARVVEMVGHFIEQTSYSKVLPFRPAKVLKLVGMVLELGVIFIAEDSAGRIVGMLAAMQMVEPVGGVRMVDEMAWWVEPLHRKGTVGPRLLQALENWARQKQCQIIKMVAPTDQPQVGAYYKRMGYEPIESAYMKRLR